LFKRIDFDLDLDEMPGDRLRTFQHGRDAARDRDVVVLDQDRVIQTEAVVESAAAAHCVFFQRAEPRRRFPCATNACLRVCGQLDECCSGRRDAGQVAEEVQGGALGRENRAGIAFDSEQRGFRRDRGTIAVMRFDRDLRIELGECRLDQRQPGHRSGLARHGHGARARSFRHRRNRGDIAGAAEILGQRARHRGIDFERREKRIRVE
jgi:hypothetical protein